LNSIEDWFEEGGCLVPHSSFFCLSGITPTFEYHLDMAVIDISEAEVTRDFASLLARVRDGAEIIIESGTRAVVRPAAPKHGPGRLLSESIASAEARGSTGTLDDGFTRDLEAAIASHREPLNPPEWH